MIAQECCDIQQSVEKFSAEESGSAALDGALWDRKTITSNDLRRMMRHPVSDGPVCAEDYRVGFQVSGQERCRQGLKLAQI